MAGDDARTKSKAMAQIDKIGFGAVDACTIADSWRQQPGSPGYLTDYDVKGVRSALAEATPPCQPYAVHQRRPSIQVTERVTCGGNTDQRRLAGSFQGSSAS